MRHANQAEAMPKETLARRSCKYQPEAGADGLGAAGLLRAEQTPTLQQSAPLLLLHHTFLPLLILSLLFLLKRKEKKSIRELRGKTQTLTIHFSLRTA